MTFKVILGNCVAVMTNHSKCNDSHELSQRKRDHIELTGQARTGVEILDSRFNYEPLFFTHPAEDETCPIKFLGHKLDWPLWISSMTGGPDVSEAININLAKLCGEFKLGMGLGSCRPLLHGDNRKGFEVRKYLGEQPLFANLGLAQLEMLINENRIHAVHEMVHSLEATGLIIHINPLQEWIQIGGDRFKVPPLETLKTFLDRADYPVIVKEVGQGMGPRSLMALLDLPIAGIEFGAFGGTNFSLLEDMRTEAHSEKKGFIRVGHSANEMVETLNGLPAQGKQFIISGGISSILDGHYLMMRMKSPSVIGMASAFLGPARESYESLRNHFLGLKEALLVARGILSVKENL